MTTLAFAGGCSLILRTKEYGSAINALCMYCSVCVCLCGSNWSFWEGCERFKQYTRIDSYPIYLVSVVTTLVWCWQRLSLDLCECCPTDDRIWNRISAFIWLEADLSGGEAMAMCAYIGIVKSDVFSWVYLMCFVSLNLSRMDFRSD